MTASKLLTELDPDIQAKVLADPKRLVQDDKGGIMSPYFEIDPGWINAGKYWYDRPLIREKKAVIAIIWGRDMNGKVRIGMTR